MIAADLNDRILQSLPSQAKHGNPVVKWILANSTKEEWAAYYQWLVLRAINRLIAGKTSPEDSKQALVELGEMDPQAAQFVLALACRIPQDVYDRMYLELISPGKPVAHD